MFHRWFFVVFYEFPWSSTLISSLDISRCSIFKYIFVEILGRLLFLRLNLKWSPIFGAITACEAYFKIGIILRFFYPIPCQEELLTAFFTLKRLPIVVVVPFLLWLGFPVRGAARPQYFNTSWGESAVRFLRGCLSTLPTTPRQVNGARRTTDG